MFSSDRLRKWLLFAESRAIPDRIPRAGPAGEDVRGLSVLLFLEGEQLLFRRIEGDDVVCITFDGNGCFGPEKTISIYDAWLAKPTVVEYYGLVQFTFRDWATFAREQKFRLSIIRFKAKRVLRSIRAILKKSGKQVAVERYAVLKTVKRLRVGDRRPTSWDVASSLLGEYWTDNTDAFERLDQVEAMLDALEDLGELKRDGIRFFVSGKGVASLSQYEEEERKHRETIKMQKGIRWLTVLMAIAALLQANVIKVPTIL